MYLNSLMIIWILPLAGILMILIFSFIWHFNKIKKYRLSFIHGVKWLSFFTTILIFLFSLAIWFSFNSTSAEFQFVTTIYHMVFPFSEALYSYIIGIDGLSLFFVILTAFIFPLCFLASWEFLDKEPTAYVILYCVSLLFLEFCIINAFCVLDIFYFFIFFESLLIPMLLIIGIWGPGDRKIKANYYFAFYTLAGSAFLLFALILILYEKGSTSFLVIFNTYIENPNMQKLIWFGLFISFAIKVPMFPFHIWLPEAHVEAPTTGSVILASLLLKLGGYGLIRFIPLVPYAYMYYNPIVYTLGVISIFYASLTTIRQIDLKKIIAYSSVAHMNLIVVGIFSLNFQSIQGSVFLMLSHGLVSSALFFLVGMLYDRYYTKFLKYYGGLVFKMPLFAISFFFFSISNLAFPGTSNFIGELIILIGIAEKNITVMVISAGGMLFSSIYSMWLFNRVVFGTLKLVYIKAYCDLLERDYMVIVPLVSATLLLGVVPGIVLESTTISLKLWSSFSIF